jgi:hypothetical protein
MVRFKWSSEIVHEPVAFLTRLTVVATLPVVSCILTRVRHLDCTEPHFTTAGLLVFRLCPFTFMTVRAFRCCL